VVALKSGYRVVAFLKKVTSVDRISVDVESRGRDEEGGRLFGHSDGRVGDVPRRVQDQAEEEDDEKNVSRSGLLILSFEKYLCNLKSFICSRKFSIGIPFLDPGYKTLYVCTLVRKNLGAKHIR
jgi:hypothetical protein